MNNSLIGFLVFILFLSCDSPNSYNPGLTKKRNIVPLVFEKEANLDIEVSRIENEIFASDLFDSIVYIGLETTPYNLIGNIKKIISTGDDLIVFDDITQSILLFHIMVPIRNLITKWGGGLKNTN